MAAVYTKDYFDSHRPGSDRSARVIVPVLLELIQPRSVVDVGCGTGTWLAVFRRHGIEDVLGIDGQYVRSESLEISSDRFYPFDLSQPLHLERRFDLVVSLEVAEHLPPTSADSFVDSLVRLGPIVLFSAAVPGQGGTHHLNEQWPEYWAERFGRRSYVAIDALRPLIWNAADVEFWYAQNLLLFVEANVATADTRLSEALARTRPDQLAVIHPRLFEQVRCDQQAATAAAADGRASAVSFYAELEQLKAEIARHRSTATHYMAESAVHRAKADAFFAELEQLKGEAAHHRATLRATVEHYMAESAEHRAKADAFFAEIEQLKGEAAHRRATAEAFFTELEQVKSDVERLRGTVEHYMAESAEHRAKADAFFAEIEQLKGEAAYHRATAEHYIAESAEQAGKADYYYAESTRLGVKLAAARDELDRLGQALTAALQKAEYWGRRADPRTASLRRVLRELPIVIVSALKRRFGWRHTDRQSLG